ncbi:hypothetical protein EV421DRAFT_1904138 [Armillaria borealis]|uniref:Uncharacterized protein n=1 Tax=Armillaria borealis TaxID=47425 RepID=A0AA39JGH2_9AGAR|nr:hypothetical protein EV421DRAFT_1904138 [Armillaria borealis]
MPADDSEDPANIIEGKRRRVQSECSKASEGHAAEGSDQASTASTARSCPKKRTKVANAAKTIIKTVVHKLTPAKVSSPQTSARSGSPSPSGNAASNLGAKMKYTGSSVSVQSKDLPDLIEVRDSDDEEDAASANDVGATEDDDEKELQWALKTWNAPVYAFYAPIPCITYHEGGQKCYVWMCMAKGCGHEVTRFQDTSDSGSMKNLHAHVKKCWGEDILKAADMVKDLKNARDIIKAHRSSPENGSITAAFSRMQGKGTVVYSLSSTY